VAIGYSIIFAFVATWNPGYRDYLGGDIV